MATITTQIIQDINKASVKLLEPLTIEETYKRITDEAVNLVKGEAGKLVLKRGNHLEGVYLTKNNKRGYLVRKNGNTYLCYKKREAFVIYPRTFKDTHPEDFNEGYKSGIFIPLYYKERSFGVLLVKSKRYQRFTSDQLEILKLFGSIASLTIRKTELLRETKQNLELQDKFIAIAAHELRTPLTSMSGFIQLLHRKLSKTHSKEAEWTESLLQESDRLKELIEEILEINRVNAGKIQYTYKENHLDELIVKSISSVKKLFPIHSIFFEKTKSYTVVGDGVKLSRAIFNILENAVKFSSEKDTIVIRLKEAKSYIIIEIQDFGKGISEEDLPLIFEEFYKGKENNHTGMGLGLYYAKKIVEDHKGKIQVNSEKDKGTTVQIKLPESK